MTASSQSARDILDAWQSGRRDPELVDDLARFVDVDDLTCILWVLRQRPGRKARLELLTARARLEGLEIAPVPKRLLGGAAASPIEAEQGENMTAFERCMQLDRNAELAREEGDAERARKIDHHLEETLEGGDDPFRHLLERRRTEDALSDGDAGGARAGLDRLLEGLPALGELRDLLEPGIDLLRARLQEIDDDPECLWSYLSLSRDQRLLDSDREEATLRAAEVMSQRGRLAGALALQLELVHGRAGLAVRIRALHALVRDISRGSESAAARSYAESLVELAGEDHPAIGDALGMAAFAAIRAGDALTALDFLDRASAHDCDPALRALVETIEMLDRDELDEAIGRAAEALKTAAPEKRPGPWRGLLALEQLQALRRKDAPFDERMRAAEAVLREAAHARDMETLRDAYFSLALLLSEQPESRDRAIAACREAESLTRNLLESVDADRELLLKIMPRDTVIRTVVSSLMGRITEHAGRSITQLIELGASLAREAERGRELLEALRASQRRVSRLLEAMPIVIWTSWGRSRDFALCSVEGSVGPIFATTAEELRASPLAWLEMIEDEERKRVESALTAAEDRLEGRSVEFRVGRGRPDPIWVEMHIRPILGDPHNDGVLHGFMSDVSERRLLQENIQRVQKLEGLGRLAGGITHDFNNLLGGILGAATLLMQSTPESSAQAELLGVIEKAAVRGTELVASLRGFASPDREQKVVVDLASLARESVELGRRLLGHDIEVLFNGPDEGCWIECHSATMTQVLLELMTNADETDPGDRRIRIDLEDDGDRPVLKVADRGRGMDYETRSRAFDPFFSTKDARRHRGLGLTMVYQVVHEMGGEVVISSEVGGGTEVSLFLPRAEAPAPSEQVERRDLRGLLAEGRLLLIEDDPEIRRVSEIILTQAGFDVLVARDGREGLDLFEESAEDWALVVTDLRMPRCDGVTVAGKIRERGPKPPILVMTGYAEEAPGSLLGKLDGVAVIRKPFTATAFLDAAGRLVSGD